MDPHCQKFETFIDGYFSNELSDDQLEFTTLHADRCSACLDAFERVASSAHLKNRLKFAKIDAPASLLNKIQQQISSPARQEKKNWLPWFLPLSATSFAAAALVFTLFANTHLTTTPRVTARHAKPSKAVTQVAQANHIPLTSTQSIPPTPRSFHNSNQTSAFVGAPSNYPPLVEPSQRSYQVPQFSNNFVSFSGWDEKYTASNMRSHPGDDILLRYHLKGSHRKTAKRDSTFQLQRVDASTFNSRQFKKKRVKGVSLWVAKRGDQFAVYRKTTKSKGYLFTSNMPQSHLLNIAGSIKIQFLNL